MSIASDTMTLMCFLSFILFVGTELDYEDKIQELQEELKAERKIKKKMAQELDTLQKRQDRHGVECKEVETQFSYLQPVSGTITLHDHCNGM